MSAHLDGQLIGIFKIAENEYSADYIFCAELWVLDENHKSRWRPHQTNFGCVKIHKDNGEVQIVYPMPDDTGDRRAFAVGHKLRQHCREGTFPNAMVYASG